MKKTGPCCHCGVTSTPLWRNGPPDKPILCNACGSRWRTKGSLTNYTPLHAREAFELEELKSPIVKTLSFKPKEHKLHIKKQNIALDNEHELQYCDQNYQKMVEGDTSNPSNSGPCGSTMSYSESCAHFSTNDANDITGCEQSNVWDPLVPSKKRTFVTRPKTSPVEKLTKELYSILHEQQSCNLSECSEDDLLYDSVTPLDSSEIGYGSVLIRHPYSKSVEEESEASSLPLDKKVYMKGGTYLRTASFPVNTDSMRVGYTNLYPDKLKSSEEVFQDNTKRSKAPHEKYRILRDRGSPLVTANLTDVANFETFMKFLTLEEQQKLMKYLPVIDTSRPPESIKNMFRSPQFLESIAYFQQFLQEGIFDLSFTLANADECKSLRGYLLSGLTKSEWVEYHKSLKDEALKKRKGGKELTVGRDSTRIPKLASMKKSCDPETHSYSELKGAMRSPKRVCIFEASNPAIIGTDEPSSRDEDLKLINDVDNLVEDEGIGPRSFFVSPHDSVPVQAPSQLITDGTDQDLLVDMPSSASFAEAELLYPPWKDRITSQVSALGSGLAEREDSRSSFTCSSFSIIQTRSR